MKKAVIDVGSQSLRLLSFSGKEDLVKGVDRAVLCPLAKDLQDGYLKEERKLRAIGILGDFIKDFPKEGLFLYATSAVREAEDGQEFIDKIRTLFGIHAEILSGEEEARLGYEGAKLLAGDKPFSLIDLGGGSTEIVTPESRISIPMGVVRYEEGLSLGDYFTALPEIKGELFGIGGSLSVFTTLSQGANIYQRSLSHGKKISREQIEALTNKMEAMSLDERETFLGEFKGRKETIVPGGKILVFLLDKLGIKELIYSDFSNLEGYAVTRGLL